MLEDSGPSSTRPSPLNHYFIDTEDFLLQFVTKMSRLIFCCITFHDLADYLSEMISFVKKVIPNRPSLWFYVGMRTFEEDPNMPLIHYLEMIDSTYYFPPPTI